MLINMLIFVGLYLAVVGLLTTIASVILRIFTPYNLAAFRIFLGGTILGGLGTGSIICGVVVGVMNSYP